VFPTFVMFPVFLGSVCTQFKVRWDVLQVQRIYVEFIHGENSTKIVMTVSHSFQK